MTLKLSGKTHKIQVRGTKMLDWQGFHDEFAKAVGFPAYYGENLDAWIDCMSSLTEDGSAVQVEAGDVLLIEVLDSEEFYERHAEIAAAMHQCASFVNKRGATDGQGAFLMFVDPQ